MVRIIYRLTDMLYIRDLILRDWRIDIVSDSLFTLMKPTDCYYPVNREEGME